MEELIDETVLRVVANDDLNSIRDLIVNSGIVDLDVRLFLDKLKLEIKDINKRYFGDKGDSEEKYTLMQFAAKCNFTTLIQALLELNVDPNFTDCVSRSIRPGKKARADTETNVEIKHCRSPAILIAAENGYHEILKILRDHNFGSKRQENELTTSNHEHLQEDTTPLKKEDKTCYDVDFGVSHPVTKETVLHIVLQQRLLKSSEELPKLKRNSLVREQRQSTHRHGAPTFQPLLSLSGKKLKIADNYIKSANILLGLDEFEDHKGRSRAFLKPIRSIVNQQDIKGNTPLHYAVSNWPERTVKRLLNLGSNPSIRNDFKESPLSRIKYSTFKDFMDRQCIVVEDLDLSDDEIDDDDDKVEDDSEGANKHLEDYDHTFMMHISQCGQHENNKITFDYAFLAPPKLQRSLLMRQRFEGSFPVLDEENNRENYEETDDTGVSYLSEMELLSQMSQCPETRSLLKHPVIDSYLWLKWKLMTKFFNRNVRLDFLFLYCVTWFIFDQYGGQKWNSVFLHSNSTQHATNLRNFCAEQPYRFEVITIEPFNFIMMWYLFFLFQAAGQIIYILRDLRRDLSMKFSENYKESKESPIAAGWLDALNFSLILLVIVCGKGILWFVINILLLVYILSEFVQMINSRSQYFREKGNWIDFAIICFLMVVMYVPNEKIKNPYKFSVFDDESDLKNIDETDKCRVKRAVSAVLIVLIWSRFLMSIAKFPGWKEYNLYVIMFYKVMQRYIKILAWYSIYLIAFGLGFYIMLHDDTGNISTLNKDASSKETVMPLRDRESRDSKKTTFDNPYLALAKTSVMFIGEIEFGDLPIHGGDINVTMAHLFLLLFIFLMIVVLMNLLNGLAVSDTGKIVADSEISSQITFIKTIQYFESVYIGHVKWVRFLQKINPKLKSFLKKHFVPRGLLVFHSPYMKDKEMKLSLPLKQQKLIFDCGSKHVCCNKGNGDQEVNRNTSKNSYCSRIIEKLFGNDENYGSKEFLDHAREILIQEKLDKIKRGREDMKQKRKKKRQEDKEKRMKNIEKILQAAFSAASNDQATQT